MLTYSLEKDGGESLYTQLYACIRRDILSGTLSPRQKLPSKRALALHLEVSVITVKNAYEQLAAEGYIYTVEKKGYYVSPLESPLPPAAPPPLVPERPAEPVFLDLATGSLDRSYFPFTVWSRLMRQTILEEDTELLRSTPYNGAPALRRAIAAHLRQFRAMDVDPEQIIIGAGTELLYTLIIQLLGRDKRYAVEDPGYGKIAKIYQAHQVPLCRVGLDGGGLDITLLRRQPADVVHISPSHHYPTGIVMPITRRQELLRWAAEQPERYILEDDYDSEFRFVGRPIPTLFSVSENQRVIYLNTFSKTIAPSIRISYMILPPQLLARYLQRMIKTARVIEDRSRADTVGLYDTVEILMENTGRTRKIQLVTTLRQDALKGLISKESPVGKAVLGKRAGDRVQVDMGGGRSYWLKILSIEKGTDDGSIPIGSF